MTKRDIPLKAGDKIYGVYQSCVQFNEEGDRPRYYIRDFVSRRDDFPLYRSDSTAEDSSRDYVSDDPLHHPKNDYFGFCSPTLTGFYLDQAKAKAATKTVYRDAFKSLPCQVIELSCYSIDGYQVTDLDLSAWAKTHNIQIAEGVDQSVSNYLTRNYPAAQYPEAWLYYLGLLTSLEQQQRFDQLYELWEYSKRHPLAFIQEYVIDRDCYLRLSKHSGG